MSGPLVQNSIIPSNQFPSSYVGDQGPSAFDQRNHAVVNFTWQPVVHKTDALSRYLLNGWLISGIGTYSSSMFVTPTMLSDGQQFTTKVVTANYTNTAVTMDFPGTLNGTGGW